VLADNSSVIAATATTTTTGNPSAAPATSPAAATAAVKAGDKRFPKACIKKVKFSSESLKSEVEELCEQLKDSALTDLSNDNIRITCHQNNNNSINKNQNNNSIDINIGKMSETNESNDTAAQSAEGERPSFLV